MAMNEALRSRYLYALGVPEFLYVKTTKDSKPQPIKARHISDTQKINTKCLVIEATNSHSFCQPSEQRDFLLKMLSAIGLKPKNIHCISIEVNELNNTLVKYHAKTVLLTSKSLLPSSTQHFQISHPSLIMANEQLKREAWETLKQVKQCLQ